MRMTSEQITAFVKDMQDNDDIKKNAHPEYFIETTSDIIKIYGANGNCYKTSTGYLCDVHAILQQCHPDGAYSVEIWPHGFAGYYEGPIYSHSYQPSALSANHHVNGGPRKHYTWNMQHIPDIIVPCDEPLSHAIKRTSKHITKNFDIAQKNPNIFHDRTYIKTTSQISRDKNQLFDIDLKLEAAKDSSNISILITVKYYLFIGQSLEFSISPAQIAQLLPLYQQHIQPFASGMRDFVSGCIHHPITSMYNMNEDANPAYDNANLEHNGTNPAYNDTIEDITNAINTALTDTNGKIFHDIQRCIDILQNHYIYVPESNTTKAA